MNKKIIFKSKYFTPTTFLLLVFLSAITLLVAGGLNLFFIIVFMIVLYAWLSIFFREITYFSDSVVISFPFRWTKIKINYDENFILVYNHKGARNPPNIFFYNKSQKSKKIILLNSLLYAFEIYNRAILINFFVEILKVGVKVELQVSENNLAEISQEIKIIYPEVRVYKNILTPPTVNV